MLCCKMILRYSAFVKRRVNLKTLSENAAAISSNYWSSKVATSINRRITQHIILLNNPRASGQAINMSNGHKLTQNANNPSNLINKTMALPITTETTTQPVQDAPLSVAFGLVESTHLTHHLPT